MSDFITKEEAETRRDVGMARAVDHADRVDAQWSDRAYGYLFDFCRLTKQEGERFVIEDVRVWAAGQGFNEATDGRAWGAVIRRAASNGLIQKVGYAPAKSSNMSPKCAWIAA